MKAILLYSIAICAALQASAQKLEPKAVPVAVQTAFAARFAGVTQVKWEKEDANYEAEFKQGKQELSVKMSEAGAVLEVEREIKVSELPAAVAAAIAKEFAGYKIKEVEVIEANGSTSYEAELSNGKEKFDAVFDVSGKLINKSKEESAKQKD